MYPHPIAFSQSTCSLVWAPSAMIIRCSFLAITIMDWMIFMPLPAFSSLSSMNFVSSLITSTLMSLSMFSEEYAEPKSSISTTMPLACSLRMVSFTTGRFFATALSVISTCNRRASTSYSFSSPPITSATSIWLISIMDTFTETGTRLRPSRSHLPNISATKRHTNRSTWQIRPALSNTGTNHPGEITPYLG